MKCEENTNGCSWDFFKKYFANINNLLTRTTISQDVQTRFPVQLAFAKFLSKIKGNF